jgi:hypothetical protein
VLLYDYFQEDVRGTALLLFFLHQLMIDYFKQLNMSTVGNGTAGAFGTGPASGYNLKLSCLFVVFVLFLYRLITSTNNLYATIILLILNNSMNVLLNFGIKIYRKMPKHLTLYRSSRPRIPPALPVVAAVVGVVTPGGGGGRCLEDVGT